ncbi:hypothetical protein KK083_24590 [Fulvivirgaceae bacterium PWU4]|uniref:Uncharacterized protein n=1 Tax=Chryseosolibacter histidini TaxID=2782349 RepID=A0AAP2GLG1_9BACT|nr:hypothetical protein [Chryseosolibacter histidini]MBT1700089.1 hypothetical protein [Chryseosolibacter histidini]
MDLSIKKIELIAWLTGIEDESLINKIAALKKETEADWWDALNEEQKQDIEAGISDLEAGRKKDFFEALSSRLK